MLIDGTEEYENRAAYIAALLAFLPMVIVLGLRSDIGDSLRYIEAYNEFKVPENLFDGISERNPGYDVMMRIFKKTISDNAYYWLLFMTALSTALMLKTFSDYSPMFALSAYIFFGSTEVSYVFNGARQFLAMTILVFAFRYFEKGKLIPSALFLAFAASVHLTALVFIPVYIFARGKFLNFKMILASLATVVATVFSSLFIGYVNDLFIEDSVYSGYSELIAEGEGVNIYRTLVAAIPFIICLIYKKRIDELNDKTLNFCANTSMFGLAVLVFSLTSGGSYIGRLAEYFLIFNCLLYPMLLKKVISKNVYHIILIALIVGFFFFFTYQFYVKWNISYVSDFFGVSIGGGEA